MSEHVVNGNGFDGTNGVSGQLSNDPVELWRHPRPESTELYAFQQQIQGKFGLSFATYDEFWQWSVDRPADFWEAVWHYTGIKAHKTYDTVRQVKSASDSND
jgi:acetoacetyl-CoA synthetase